MECRQDLRAQAGDDGAMRSRDMGANEPMCVCVCVCAEYQTHLLTMCIFLYILIHKRTRQPIWHVLERVLKESATKVVSSLTRCYVGVDGILDIGYNLSHCSVCSRCDLDPQPWLLRCLLGNNAWRVISEFIDR